MKQVIFNATSGSPGTALWHSWRLDGIGSSDAPIIAAAAGLVKPAAWMKSLEHLWQVKTGRRAADIVNSWVMQRGTNGEGPARDLYEKSTCNAVSPMFGEMDGYEFIHSSFDGVDFDQKLLAEIKCPGDQQHNAAKRGEVVGYYLPQMAHQAMTLWGHPESWPDGIDADYVSYIPETKDLAVVRNTLTGDGFYMPLVSVLRDMAIKLLPLEVQFWQDVQGGILPCGTDWRDAATNYLVVQSKIEALTLELNDARSVLIDLLGKNGKMSGAGVSVARQVKQGSVDYKAILAANQLQDVDVEPFRKKGTTSIVVRTLANVGDIS